MPSFWLGVMLLLTFAVWLRWLPPAGYVPFGEDPVESLRHVALPAVTLGVGLAAPLARFLRSGMAEVMGQDYIRTAHAKGLRRRSVILRHALKNALLSVVTVFALLFGSLLGGAIITESVFNWPGIGTLFLRAIQQRDYGVVQGIVLCFGRNYLTQAPWLATFPGLAILVAVLGINLLGDGLRDLLDPRLARVEER
jgi:peptide/nickel transport system permease protein